MRFDTKLRLTPRLNPLNKPIAALAAQILRMRSYLRLRPFETETVEGRAQERMRRVVLTAVVSAAARGISLLTSLISIPLTIDYLGAERYGLWMTISSTIAILGFADFGIGNGLVNAIAEAHGKNDRRLAREYISSALFMLSSIAFLTALIFVFIYPRISWANTFNVTSSQAVLEVGPAIAVFVGCFLVNLPLGVIQRTQMGYQEGFANGIWRAAGNLLGLAGVVLAITLRAGLPWLVLAMSGAPVIATLLNGIVVFGFQRPWLRPQFRSFSTRSAGRILNVGVFFFVLQVASAVGYRSDNIILARILGPEMVTQYAVPLRLFSIIPMLQGFVLMPLWPAYGESTARGDVAWIKKTLRRSLVLSVVVSAPLVLVLVVFGVPILHWWVGPEVTPSTALLAGFGLWTLLSSLGGPLAMFLNGLGVMKFQAVCATLMAAANVALSIYLVRTIGLPGIIISTIIAQVIFILLPTAFYVPRLWASLQSKKAG